MEQISLDDMRLFVAVVQAGSLSHASDLTKIPVSKLSRRLTRLEQELGTKLLHRGKKGVRLNEVGERFFIQSQLMLQQAYFAVESVRDSLQRPQGLLRISVASDIYRRLLEPHLNEFLQRYPDVNLEISLSPQKINMIQDGIDLAIRAGTVDSDNVVAKQWLAMPFGLFSSLDYLKNNPILSVPNDLYQHQIISQTNTLPWRFIQDGHQVEIRPVSRISCNDFNAVESLIRQGAGIGILPIIEEDGYCDLVRLLPDWQLPADPISLLYYKNSGAAPTVRAMVAFLLETNK